MTGRLEVTLLLILLASGAQAAQPPAESSLLSRALAVTPDPEHGKILYLKHCLECHRGHAWGDGVREIPSLAAEPERYIVLQLVRFASGERAGSELHGPAMYDAVQAQDVLWPQGIHDLAAYLARAELNPRPETGDGAALALGKRTYARACEGCHGSTGAGSAAAALPRIAGQHYTYLLSRLRTFASVHRGQIDARPADSAAGLTAEEQRGVADYLSRLGDTGTVNTH